MAIYRNQLKDLIENSTKKGIPINLELTEQVIFQEWEFVETISKELEVNLVIDDFGTGYSSLKLVADLVAKGINNTIKIDMSLVKDYLKNPYIKALVDSILAFTKSMQINTVIEGIEAEEQFEVFKGLGATYGQSWYFYKPMPLEEVLKLFT